MRFTTSESDWNFDLERMAEQVIWAARHEHPALAQLAAACNTNDWLPFDVLPSLRKVARRIGAQVRVSRDHRGEAEGFYHPPVYLTLKTTNPA